MTELKEEGGTGKHIVPFLEAMAKPMEAKVRQLTKDANYGPADTDKALGFMWRLAEKSAFSPLDLLLNPGKANAEWEAFAQQESLPNRPGLAPSIVNTVAGFLNAAMMFGADNIAAGFGALNATLPAVVTAIGRGMSFAMDQMGLGDLSKNLDISGDPLAFFGSLTDIVIDERKLTAGPLPIKELLQYENRLQGLRLAVVLVSYIFSIVVEVASLGQVEGHIGILLHLIDEVVADASKVVSTQLIRKAVADPFTDFYTSIHRTKDASTSELDNAYAEGIVDDQGFVEGLATAGFTDKAIQIKLGLARVGLLRKAGVEPSRTKPAAPSILEYAMKNRLMSPEAAMQELARGGYSDVALQIYWHRFNVLWTGKVEKGPGGLPTPFPGLEP